MDVVTIMDYPDDEKYNLLCMIWLRRMRLHAPDARLHLFTLRGLPPAVQRYAAALPRVSVEPALFRPLAGYDHFNLAVKLPTLSRLDYPFVFFDADIFLISDLALKFADSFLRPRRLQDRILRHLIRPHLTRRKVAGPAVSSANP